MVFAETTEQKLANTTTGKDVAGMKPSTSKAGSSAQSPPPEEPNSAYVNNELPDPDDEPLVSEMTVYNKGQEEARLRSQEAYEKFQKTRQESISSQRAVTAQLYHRFTEDEERKRMEHQKNKEAMNASVASASRNGHIDNRKRRNDVGSLSAEEEWRRAQQQQHWMGQAAPMHPSYQMQQQYHQQQVAAQHHQFMAPHSVPTPGSIHRPSPSGMQSVCLPTSDENSLDVPNGEWFDKLAVMVAEKYDATTILGPDTYDVYLNELDAMEPVGETVKTPSEAGQSASQPMNPQQQQMAQQQNKMRMLQQQEMMEQQRQQQMMHQHQQQHRQQQMLLQQQQMHQLQQQNQMNGGQFTQAQQHAVYLQRMQHMRLQQQQQQQQQQAQHHQQAQQHQQPHQNGVMGYSVPNGYAHPNGYAPYGHHMPHHTPFANING
ncbi:hypothetical protein L3Y34_001657 [Caenorhabditis briggsae]|uniref:Uncharacterized protein n=2 Tax=Caenorhabditis briggsae TaxID=6238 RepID=A0AAE9IQ27_CAEBR|nr:hypothetical protein L3Y34_001657 [Caenorhabditis briggsae]